MWFSAWRRKHTRTRTPEPRASRCPIICFRPRLEALEGRDVPSTLTVTNTLDSGPGSLRAEKDSTVGVIGR
jgi:hypothetical protein